MYSPNNPSFDDELDDQHPFPSLLSPHLDEWSLPADYIAAKAHPQREQFDDAPFPSENHQHGDENEWMAVQQLDASFRSTSEQSSAFDLSTPADNLWQSHEPMTPISPSQFPPAPCAQTPSSATPAAVLHHQDIPAATVAHIVSDPTIQLQCAYAEATAVAARTIVNSGRMSDASGASSPAVVAAVVLPDAASGARSTNRAVKRTNDERDGVVSSASSVAVSAPLSSASPSSPSKSSASSSTASVASSPAIAEAVSAGAQAADRMGLRLYSQSCYAALEAAGIRDLILGMHAQLLELPADMAHLFEFNQQVHMMLLMISEDLSHEDFISFLTGGRSEEEREHSDGVWKTSPLALWSKYETRPSFHVYPSAEELESLGLFSSSRDLRFEQDLHGELVLEWISERSQGTPGRRWPNIIMDQVRRNYRKAVEMETNDTRIDADATMSVSSAETINNGQPMTSATANENNHSGGQVDSAFSNMLNGFNLLSIANTLSLEPSPHASTHSSSASPPARFHGQYCPAISSAQQYHKRPRTEHSGATNTSANASSGSAPSVSDPSMVCICSASAPMVFRLGVNAAFTKTFGWRACDITAGFSKEGQLCKRHMHPPSVWLRMHQNETAGWRTCLEFVGRTAIVDAQVRLGVLPKEAIGQIPLPASSPPFDLHIRHKSGEILPRPFVGWSKVLHPSEKHPFAGVTTLFVPKEG